MRCNSRENRAQDSTQRISRREAREGAVLALRRPLVRCTQDTDGWWDSSSGPETKHAEKGVKINGVGGKACDEAERSKGARAEDQEGAAPECVCYFGEEEEERAGCETVSDIY